MPGPPSATSSTSCSPLALARMIDVPPRGEYLMALDSRFSRIRRILPRSAISVNVLDLHVEPHALRHQRQLLVLQHLLDQRAQAELGRLEADAVALPGAEGQQVLDHALQLDAVLAQDRRDLALAGLQLADRAVHQQLGALADVGQRRLQLVRHVAQEAVALLRQLEQAVAQPLELVAEALQVDRPADRDFAGEIAARPAR